MSARAINVIFLFAATLAPMALCEEELSNAVNATPDLDAMFAVSYTQKCFGFTGGTCATAPCSPERKAVCQKTMCVCQKGCSGPSGTCHSQMNNAVASGFTLRNVKWSSYALYVQRVTAFNQMKVTNAFGFLNFGKDKFSLYELPGTLNGEKKFFLGSDKWTRRVAAIRKTTGTTLGLHGLYAVKLRARVLAWQPEKIALTVCSLRSKGYPDAVMIGNADSKENPIWAYLQHGSWLVYGYQHGDPKEGGYWTVRPPIPKGILPDC